MCVSACLSASSRRTTASRDGRPARAAPEDEHGHVRHSQHVMSSVRACVCVCVCVREEGRQGNEWGREGAHALAGAHHAEPSPFLCGAPLRTLTLAKETLLHALSEGSNTLFPDAPWGRSRFAPLSWARTWARAPWWPSQPPAHSCARAGSGHSRGKCEPLLVVTWVPKAQGASPVPDGFGTRAAAWRT